MPITIHYSEEEKRQRQGQTEDGQSNIATTTSFDVSFQQSAIYRFEPMMVVSDKEESLSSSSSSSSSSGSGVFFRCYTVGACMNHETVHSHVIIRH